MGKLEQRDDGWYLDGVRLRHHDNVHVRRFSHGEYRAGEEWTEVRIAAAKDGGLALLLGEGAAAAMSEFTGEMRWPRLPTMRDPFV